MKRLQIWCGAALLFSALLIGIIIFASTSTEAAPPPAKLHHPSIATTSRTQTSYVAGVPAITPPVTTQATTNTATPRFTKQDVINYFNQKKLFDADLVPGAQAKIVSIQFVTAKQASNLMDGEDIGRPDDDLVCYVRVQGPFSRQNTHQGPYVPGKKAPPAANFAHVVFDGQTGNMLVWGMGNS